MAGENANIPNGPGLRGRWPYPATVAVLAVALVAAIIYIIIGQARLRKELAQIRSVSSNTSTVTGERFDTQGKRLNLIGASLQRQAKAESRATQAMQAALAAQGTSLGTITGALQQQGVADLAAAKAMDAQQLAQSKILNHLKTVQQQQTAVIYAA
ncbi:MAG: hypothetical protein ACP5O7_09295, partial [Phycisphaerae bacterium]